MIDQRHHRFRRGRLLQPPVDGIVQPHDLRRGRVGGAAGLFMAPELPDDQFSPGERTALLPFYLTECFLVNLLEAVLKNITSFQISAFRIICKRSERSQTLFCRCPAVFPRGYQPVKIFCQQFKIQCLKCDMPDRSCVLPISR